MSPRSVELNNASPTFGESEDDDSQRTQQEKRGNPSSEEEDYGSEKSSSEAVSILTSLYSCLGDLRGRMFTLRI